MKIVVILNEPLPGRDSLIIDNSSLTAEEAAERIARHFELQRVAPQK